MKLTEKEKDQILKSWAEAMSKIIERMSIEMWELEEENKKLKKELELVRKNTRANVETLDLMYWENVDLKKENKELQRENIKLKAQIEKMSWIWLVSAAPTVILDN